MDERLELTPGTFAVYTGSRFRIGHVRDPYHLYEAGRELLRLLTDFTAPRTLSECAAERGISASPYVRLAAAIDDMQRDGILRYVAEAAEARDPSGDPAESKYPPFELRRAASQIPEIEEGYPRFLEAWRQVGEYTLTSTPLAFA